MSIDAAVIPVAGRGTRLLPLTKSQPKEMLPLGRKPVVQYVVEELAACGMHRMLFVTGPGKTAIENHFDIDAELTQSLRETGKEELLRELAFERDDIEYFYTRQRRQLGLGHAVLCAKPMVGQQPFVVALGDSVIGLGASSRVVARLIDEFERHQADAVVAFEEVPKAEVSQYGIAEVAGKNNDADAATFTLRSIVEKPAAADAPSNLAVAARYVCSPRIFEFLERTPPGKSGEIQFTDALRLMIESGGRVLGVRLAPEERRYDVGNFNSYFSAFVETALADPDCGEALRQHVNRLLRRD